MSESSATTPGDKGKKPGTPRPESKPGFKQWLASLARQKQQGKPQNKSKPRRSVPENKRASIAPVFQKRTSKSPIEGKPGTPGPKGKPGDNQSSAGKKETGKPPDKGKPVTPPVGKKQTGKPPSKDKSGTPGPEDKPGDGQSSAGQKQTDKPPNKAKAGTPSVGNKQIRRPHSKDKPGTKRGKNKSGKGQTSAGLSQSDSLYSSPGILEIPGSEDKVKGRQESAGISQSDSLHFSPGILEIPGAEDKLGGGQVPAGISQSGGPFLIPSILENPASEEKLGGGQGTAGISQTNSLSFTRGIPEIAGAGGKAGDGQASTGVSQSNSLSFTRDIPEIPGVGGKSWDGLASARLSPAGSRPLKPGGTTIYQARGRPVVNSTDSSSLSSSRITRRVFTPRVNASSQTSRQNVTKSLGESDENVHERSGRVVRKSRGYYDPNNTYLGQYRRQKSDISYCYDSDTSEDDEYERFSVGRSGRRNLDPHQSGFSYSKTTGSGQYYASDLQDRPPGTNRHSSRARENDPQEKYGNSSPSSWDQEYGATHGFGLGVPSAWFPNLAQPSSMAKNKSKIRPSMFLPKKFLMLRRTSASEDRRDVTNSMNVPLQNVDGVSIGMNRRHTFEKTSSTRHPRRVL
ncbi:hypothetical protein RRG08_008746 [Elysia crispata]|uniref:Uncharacterized protein n=1 Tax=Elysia crispata TaxID=231223 RepID=A0AAE0YUD5_9GAST|nr:hypothetical protein RRG08_008746 [Elysia crispata]